MKKKLRKKTGEIKLIIFDLWQTLAYRESNYHTTSEILRLFHPNLTKRKLIKVFENSIQTKKWKSEYKAFEKLSINLGLGKNKDSIKLLMSLRDYADSKTKLYPHTISMIKRLKKQGYKIGLISNSSVFDIKYLQKATHLLKHINFPLFSFNTGVIKPNLKIFKKILKIAKCKPKETIMIGDKKKDDIIPARKIGMDTIRFRNYFQLKRALKRRWINI